MKETLLERFIREKLESYVEPERKGTPKGHPIGFSKEKYHASLMRMTKESLKDIANELGISYGLMRIWNTEEEFRKQIDRNCEEFAKFFKEQLIKKMNEIKDLTVKFLKKPLHKIAQDKTPIIDVDEFRDNNQFCQYLYDLISDVIHRDFREEKDFFTTLIIKDIGDAYYESYFSKLDFGKDHDAVMEIMNGLRVSNRDYHIHLVKHILLKPNISDDDKKIAMYCLNHLESRKV